MIKIATIEDIKPSVVETRAIRDFIWRGGTTVYRNHSLYRSNDLYRGGQSASSDAGENEIYPKMEIEETRSKAEIKNILTKTSIEDIKPSISSIRDL